MNPDGNPKHTNVATGRYRRKLSSVTSKSTDHPSNLLVEHWGRTEYRDAWQRQDALVLDRIEGRIGNTLVFTEHDPVYTYGARPGAEKHLLLSEKAAEARGIAIVKTNRGGDITYHGPGQIVGYPIISLEDRRDLHAYLRMLEQVVINALGSLGLAASRREGKTGIWLGTRKIAAIGVASRRWVTYHGFALNVNADLTPFAGIVPCGITDGTVTSMKLELNRECEMPEVIDVLADEFREQLRSFFSTTAVGS